jgi:ATP adenylyltransferase/5',5'''-P-1,P-4-tetraphosphate phosphorylase II
LTAAVENDFIHIIGPKEHRMRQLRKHPLFLLAIAVALPLGVACLYYDFYDDNDLVRHTQISMADNGDLLSFLRKNPNVFVAVDEPPQSASINLFETKSFHSINPVSTNQTSSVLRC